MKSILLVASIFVAGAGCGAGVKPGPAVPLPFQFEGRVQVRVDAWTKLAEATEGATVESQAAADVPVVIRNIFEQNIPDGPVDLVFVIDSTGSMIDDVDAVKADMREILEHLKQRNPDYRVGVVAYRDINDVYLTRTHVFLTDDDEAINSAINAIQVTGGDDWREHVYAGINTALELQPWRPDVSQHIILMGDAPPHDDYTNDPRTLDAVTAKATTGGLHVHINTIGIKCDRDCEDALAAEAKERAAQGRVLP